jgi:RND family efflux transporter MFP subunit
MTKIFSPQKIAAISLGVGAIILTSCSSHKKKDSPADTAITVMLSAPSAKLQQNLNVSGQVEAAQSANISTRIMGYITAIRVKVGDKVSKGELLATISNDDILAKRAQANAMIAEASAAVNNAKKDYDRFTILYQQQSASAKELDNVTLQYSSAKSKLEEARQMRNEVNASLGYTSLRAPFAGTVVQKLADAGSMANPGMPLLTIEGSGNYRVSAAVPENAIQLVKQGAAATIVINAINKIVKGSVTQIDQSSQFSGGQYLVKISIPESEKQGLFAGMYANVSIPVKNGTEGDLTNSQVMVPVSSLHYNGQLTGVYTVGSNHTALLRWVRLGRIAGGQAEVLSGLTPDEQFIVKADGRLYNGAPVKIK